jgi:hypothetical protein
MIGVVPDEVYGRVLTEKAGHAFNCCKAGSRTVCEWWERVSGNGGNHGLPPFSLQTNS